MQLTSTQSKWSSNWAFYLIFALLITLTFSKSYAQRVYANEAIVKSPQVENPNNAASSNGSAATVKSYGGLLLGAGKYSGELELKFPGTVPANRTTYIRIDFDPDVLNALLGGNLGSALANLVGSLVLGNHYFEAGARNGANTVLSGVSSGPFSSANLRVVSDAQGAFYIAITPSQPYDRIYVKDNTAAALFGTFNEMQVFNAFHNAGGACDAAFATDYDGTGLTASLLGIGKAGVANMEYAIDNNPETASEVGLGVIGVAGTISQNIYFDVPSKATDEVAIKLQLQPNLINVGLLNSIQIQTYRGANGVSSHTAASLLDVDLLGLLTSGRPATVRFIPGQSFDRVSISVTSLVGVSTAQNINIFSVTRNIHARPTVAAAGLSACTGNTTTLTATPNGGTSLAWFANPHGGTALANGNTYITPVLTANRTYYIEVTKDGCTDPDRTPVNVVVSPAPPIPTVAATATTCAGAGAILAVTSPDPTITYRWYEVATGGSVLFTGPIYTTANLTANKTFYVEGARGGCVSTSRAAVAVTVGPRPVLPQIEASATSVGAGQSAVLTATSTDANAIFKWYASANATTPIYTGPTFVTPPLTTTTSYHVEASFPTGTCVSSSRVVVTITVGGAVTNPVPCEAATSESNGVSGVALLAGVLNPNLAVDNDQSTSCTLLMPVGALGASVHQRLNFASKSSVGDTVRVLITSPSKLLSASLLSSIELSTSNGGTDNNDGVVISNALISVEILTGSTQAILTYVPTKVFDAVEIKLNSGLLGALTSLGINYAQRVLVAPEVEQASVSACLNQTTTLSVKNPKAGITYKWYNAAGVYQTGKDGTTFVTPTITSNTRFFVAASSASGCLSYRTAIAVNVTAPPAVPELVSPEVTTCASSTVTLQVKNPIAGLTYKWYNAAGVYQTGKDGTTFTTSAITANTTFQVEAVNNCGVASARATANVKIGSLDVPVLSPTSVTISSGTSAILTASSTSANATINWYASATSTTILSTGPTFVTPVLTATTTYYAEAVVAGGCASSGRASVTVTVGPGGPSVQAPCGSATLAIADGVNGIALFAGVLNPNLAVDDKIETASSLVMPVGVLGGYVYQRIGFTGGLSAIGDTLKIRISSPGRLLSVGVLNSLSVSTYNGSTSNNDLTLVGGSLLSLELLSGDREAIITYVPTARFDALELRLNSGVVGALTSINLNYAQRTNVSPQVQATSVSACQGTSATLSVRNPVAGVVYKWYLNNTYQTGKDGVSFATEANLAPGTYVYRVTATVRGCESGPTVVTVTVLTAPAPPVPSPGNASSTCVNTPVTLSVQPVSGITYRWFDANGTVLVVNSSSYTTPANLAVGVYEYFVEARNAANCSSSSRTKITLNVGNAATAADIQVSGSRSICSSARAVLTASSTTVNDPIFTWYSNANLTNVVFTGSVFTSPVLTTNTTYYVTVKGSNACENRVGSAAVIALVINPPALASDITVTGSTTLCGGSRAVLTASSTTVINPIFTWYSDANLTTVLFTGAVFTSPVLNANTTYYVTVRGDNRCESSAANARALAIVVNPGVPDPTISAASTNICIGSQAVLTVQNVQAGATYQWFSTAAGGTVLFTGPTYTTPVLNASTDYYVQATNSNGCTNAGGRIKVTVTVSGRPNIPTLASTAISTCTGSTATITVSNPQAGVTYSYYTAATGGTSVGNGVTFTTAALTTTTTFYVEATAGSCSSASRTAVTVTIGNILQAPQVAVQSKTVNSIQFGWTTVAGATGYEVSINGGTTWQTPSSGSNGTSHVVSGLSANQSVTIVVRATGQSSCQTSANSSPLTETTGSDGEELFIPNTFTPNGDGRNDVFFAYGTSVNKFKMRVYNQWGQHMFESNNITTGWDGTFRGGLQPTGVYVYMIEVTFSTGKTKQMKGSVTLLR
ncbi:MAG: gliding motility-associated C-terminal domain-containing protein [Pedobacter sp.]|nr:MAG: gliding motility-associated C-terminal domain-containing protein [Pedobacter sp.]